MPRANSLSQQWGGSGDRPSEHPQRFREFLAAELAALEEKLVARFELGETRASSKTLRRGSTPQSQAWKVTSSWGSDFLEAQQRRRSSHEEVLNTRSTWERFVIRLLAAEDPKGFGLADLVSRIAQWRNLEDNVTEQTTEAGVPEEHVTPHPMWMSQTNAREERRARSVRGSMTKSIFALSRVGEGGISSKKNGEEFKPKVGGVSKFIVIHPDSIFRYVWTLVGAIFLMRDHFTIPMEAVQLWNADSSSMSFLARTSLQL